MHIVQLVVLDVALRHFLKLFFRYHMQQPSIASILDQAKFVLVTVDSLEMILLCTKTYLLAMDWFAVVNLMSEYQLHADADANRTTGST